MSERPRRGKCPTAGSREVYARVCGEFQGLQSHSLALAASPQDNGDKPAGSLLAQRQRIDYSSLCSTTTLAPIGGALNIAVSGRW